MRSVELFTGAGGLAMAVSRAGFAHELVVEWDKDACDTIRENQRRGVEHVSDWPLFHGDVRLVDYADLGGPIDLVAGGPPCQPFSLGGKHRGHEDDRNMFPEVVRAVRELKPKAILVENVKGLLRDSFSNYFQYILLQLTYPELTRRSEESWADHLSRLEEHHTHGRYQGLSYQIVHQLLNAADYGVPQRRERAFIVGFRTDLGIEWSFPPPTHTQDALLHEQWVIGAYWDRNGVTASERPSMPDRCAQRVRQLRMDLLPPDGIPWRTVREAIADLPDPRQPGAWRAAHNHNYVPGARSYKGHTGSPLDEPAKTLKAGDHGVPGGENTLVYPDGSIRYLTVRESARLQSFPDGFVFHGSWTESMRQLGNAVPVVLGEAVAARIASALRQAASKGTKSR